MSIRNYKNRKIVMKYERVKELRIDNDYTQEYIAAKTKMKQPQYARYESGNRDFPVDILVKLAKIYNTSLDYIVGLTDEKILILENLKNKKSV